MNVTKNITLQDAVKAMNDANARLQAAVKGRPLCDAALNFARAVRDARAAQRRSTDVFSALEVEGKPPTVRSK